MTAKFLLDTNVLSEPPRQHPDSQVLARLRAHQQELATAAPVWHELSFGAFRMPDSRRRASLERFLFEAIARSMPVLPYDQAAAAWHASERARLVAQGKTPPYVDGQIAAIARVNDLILVTGNSADYADFESLSVEDWRSR